MLYYSTEHDPYVNLALESMLLSQQQTLPLFLLYRCTSAVIIGRNQNPWREINTRYVRQKRIALLRRESGGGTVYHDLGNVNFSFISPRGERTAEQNLAIVVRALHRLGIKAKHTAHNDILVRGYKVSGSAFRHTRQQMLHHGTLLCRTHTARLKNALHPRHIVTHGAMIASRPSSVINMRKYAPINMAILMRALSHELRYADYFPSHEGGARVFAPFARSTLTQSQHQKFIEIYARHKSWQWRVAKSAPCRLSLSHNHCYFTLYIADGRITRIEINCASRHRARIEAIARRECVGTAMDRELERAIRIVRTALRALLTHERHTYRNICATLRQLSDGIIP